MPVIFLNEFYGIFQRFSLKPGICKLSKQFLNKVRNNKYFEVFNELGILLCSLSFRQFEHG